MTPALVFIHVPKTAGFTLRRILARQYDPRFTFTIDGWQSTEETLRSLGPESRARIGLLEAHSYWGIQSFVPEPRRAIVLLRDPVDRVISQYFHVLRSPEHHLHARVTSARMALEEFATSGLAPELDNLQTRMLAGAEDPPPGTLTREHLDRALSHLESSVAAFGIQERFDESVVLMAHRLEWAGRPYYQPLNVGPNRPPDTEIGEETRAAIERANQLDRELIASAGALFERQLSAAGDDLRWEVEEFRALNRRSETHVELERRDRSIANELVAHATERSAAGDRTWALQALLKATQIDPLHRSGCLLLARLHLEAGRPDQALPWLRNLVAVDPEHREARELLATLEA